MSIILDIVKRRTLLAHGFLILASIFVLAMAIIIGKPWDSPPIMRTELDFGRSVIHKFRSQHAPVSRVYFHDLQASHTENNELLDPQMALPHVDRFNTIDRRKILQIIDSCDSKTSVKDPTEELLKLSVWTNYICKRIATLPQNFLQRTPHMHPSGQSYALLLWQHEPQYAQKLATPRG